MDKDKLLIIFAGMIVGVLAVVLVQMGNPANMGFCIACFIRDISGAMGLHQAAVVQYMRPEIIGLILGAFIAAISWKEFRSSGGSSPSTRFVLGAIMMIGALVFLGCPLRMMLRLAGGDLNALVGIPGYVVGIWVGIYFLKNEFSLGRSQNQSTANGIVPVFVAIFWLILLLSAPTFIYFSQEGPGSEYALWGISLAAGLITGLLAQRSRLCTMGGIRDLILFRDTHLFMGLVALIVVAFVGKLATGMFNPGFLEQPVAHNDAIWNFMGLAVVGFAAVLAGGCPMRQLVLAGEGNSDGLITVLGMVAGAALSHNFALAGSPAGVGLNAQIAVGVCVIVLLLIGIGNSKLSGLVGSRSDRNPSINS